MFAQPLQGDQLKDSLLKELGRSKDDTSKVKTLISLAHFFAANDSATAAGYANEAGKLSEQLNWKKGQGLYYLVMARIYKNVSDYSLSMSNARKAYDIFSNTDDKKNTAAALNYIASSYEGTSFYAKSIENNFAALKLYEIIDFTRGISICYNNIGVDYYYLRQYDKAIENYNKALTIDKNGGDKFKIGSDLDNIAIVYLDKGNYDSADVYDRAGVKMFEEVNDQPGLGRIYGNRGNILIKLYDAKAAYEYYQLALEINKKLGIDRMLSSTYGFMGELYLAIAKDTAAKYKVSSFMKKDKKTLLDSAEFYVNTAITFAQRANNTSLLIDQNLMLSETEERLGNYQNALASHKDYTLYKDSIFNDESKQENRGDGNTTTH